MGVCRDIINLDQPCMDTTTTNAGEDVTMEPCRDKVSSPTVETSSITAIARRDIVITITVEGRTMKPWRDNVDSTGKRHVCDQPLRL
jgi:hypothetical protein